MTTKQILDHLQDIYVGNHVIDILDLQDKMKVVHTEYDSCDQYITAFEEVPEQTTRYDMLINDETLVMIATKLMLES